VKNLVKKNQLMITALAIMIAIAGYLQFAGENLEEDYLAANEDGIMEVADNGGIITDNYTAEGISEAAGVDGLLDLSEEDLLSANLTEIESLDSDVDIIVDNYLDTDMEVAGTAVEGTSVASNETAEGAQTDVAEATPEEDEIPGEAVFTSTAGVAMISEAKLLKEQHQNSLEVIFSTQRELQARGLQTALTHCDAKTAILIDGCDSEKALVVSTNSTLSLVKKIESLAEDNDIPMARQSMEKGMDFVLKKSGRMEKILCMGIPIINDHSAAEIADLNDVEHLYKLLQLFLNRGI